MLLSSKKKKKKKMLVAVGVVVLSSSLVSTLALAQDPPPAGPDAVPTLPADSGQHPQQPPVTIVNQNQNQPPVVDAPPLADKSKPAGPPRFDVIRINAGVKMGYIPNSGFDSFSRNDVLPSFSLDGTYPLMTSGKLVLGAGLGWDFGGRSDTVRGLSSDLRVHRLSVPIEARYHVVPSVFAFGKVSPGATAMMASVKEAGSGNDLATTGWAFSADASVGASVLIAPRSHYERREVRFWITPEIGYSFTTTAALNANIGREDKDLLGTDQDTALRGLALNGLFWRATVGMTF
jgi:hypothetical protein